MERLSDTIVRLESFAGSDMEGNPLYKDYHGEECSELMGSLAVLHMLAVGCQGPRLILCISEQSCP